jgi:hypothetical protein
MDGSISVYLGLHLPFTGANAMRKQGEKPCGCGCGGMTRGGDSQPGHDSKLYAAIIKEVGGLLQLRGLVEKVIGRAIKVN